MKLEDINKWAAPLYQGLDQAEFNKVMSGSLAPTMDTDTMSRTYLKQLIDGAQSGKYNLDQLNSLWNQGSGMINQSAGRVANAQNALDAQASKINSAEEAVGGNYRQSNADKIAEARQNLGTYNDSLKGQIGAAQIGLNNALFKLGNQPIPQQKPMQQPKPQMPQQQVAQPMARPVSPREAVVQYAQNAQQPQQAASPFKQFVMQHNIPKPATQQQAQQIYQYWQHLTGGK
jgi:hypothetical protein